MAEIKHHPLIFTLRDAVSGNGFMASVTLTGRALMQQEDDKWWMYGVRPAAIAESGDSPQETFARFRKRYNEVLFDIAQESQTFEQFKRAVEVFFNEEDAEETKNWEAALKAVRANAQCVPEPFSALPREKAEDKPAKIQIEKMNKAARQRFSPRRDEFCKAA